ncbi:hypothetical protein PSI23_06415 [Xenorhabdus sp. XENO-10]|uniref:Transposase n=1 Tax=Xenorhabdus yunnanensis TaxID=3025878 RepID=A0ABT5LGG7_9GAMM|nr:hypothetical protein [Xenorhabdus yunnanensis]MDC9588959.1 hypothetical protein [Xenorhabdus yunnanensis]
MLTSGHFYLALTCKSGNYSLPESLKLQVLALLYENYSDFGPTLAAEKLRERHDIIVSVEMLRKWMTADGHWGYLFWSNQSYYPLIIWYIGKMCINMKKSKLSQKEMQFSTNVSFHHL